MDFFESQDQARRQTGKLVALYLLGVALIVLAIYLAVVLVLGPGDLPRGKALWHPQLFAGVTGLTVLIIALGAFYRIAQLRSGGPAVAEMLGGKPVSPNTTNPDERQLLNVVEEMAIASGLSVPAVYILPENGINAFAAGYRPSDAVVAVTRGCLESLNRDELQGVVAHEFSHILNGDMRLNIRLLGILNGILVIYLAGRVLLHSMRFSRVSGGRSSGRRGDGGGAGAIVILAIALTAIGYLGVIFSRLMQAAVSRQREYLADAAAVQFTRNPFGIGNALRKIGGAVHGSRLEASHAEEASHMFFSPGVKTMTSTFSTHPPLVKRIRAIDPSFDGKSWIVPRAREKTRPSPPVRPPPHPAGARTSGVLLPGMDAIKIPPEAILAAIGTLDDQKVSRAGNLIDRIPDAIREGVREASGAETAIYGLLLSGEERVRNGQISLLRKSADARIVDEMEKRYASLAALPPGCRLPLIDLAIPALRNLASAQYESFRQNVSRLIEADEKVSLFEFTLEKALVRHLDAHFHGQPSRGPARIYGAGGLIRELSVILSAFARTGEKDTRHAFDAGRARLGGLASSLTLLPASECAIPQLDMAIDRATTASLPVKKQILTAATYVVASDGKVAPDEAEMLRALSDSLDCPMPPLAL